MIFGGKLQQAIDADDAAAVDAAVAAGEAVSSDALGHAASSMQNNALRALLTHVEEVPATPLILAAQNGREAGLKILLDKADPNTADRSGLTPLFYAALSDELGCIDLLVAAGAQVEHQDDQKRQPLDIAIKHERRAAAEALLRHGAPVSAEQSTALAGLGLPTDPR